MYTSLASNPMMTPGFFGLPIIDGKIDLGASSPEKPALTTPDPLSITQTYDSSDICAGV
jgi:uncharacterized protein YbcC (UPF0753/DUF2309 family)